MSGEVSDAPSAPRADTVTFAVFAAANTAALHVLEMIQSQLSLSSLRPHGDTIGYHLSIPLSPGKQRFEDAWRIGAGPPPKITDKKLDHVKPDILLCPPIGPVSAKFIRRFIKDLHATINFHGESGVPMLQANSSRPVVYEHGDMDHQDLELISEKMPSRKLKTCVMRHRQNFIRIGEYRFVLEFISKQGDDDRTKAHSTEYPGLHPALALNPAPMAYTRISWNIWLHNRINGSSTTAGVNIYTGEPVAVKELQRGTYTSQRLDFALLCHQKGDRRVLGIIDVWCEHGISPPCSPDQRRDLHYDRCERTFYSMPLAKNSFRDIPGTPIRFEDRLVLFYQTLQGLAKLHQRDIVHGNIRPRSLLILGEPGAAASTGRAVISLTMREPSRRPEPSVYIAPEFWESGDDDVTLDERKLDVWALAASWLFVFSAAPKKLKMDRESYSALTDTLNSQSKRGIISKPFDKLLRRMLAWKPQDRPSATKALAHRVWQPIRDQKQEEEDSRKRKRMGLMNVDDGDKRVRVLSPEKAE